MKSRVATTLLLVCSFAIFTSGISLTDQRLEVRSSSFSGLLDVEYADFRLDFDQDLYQTDPTPCSAGFCDQSLVDDVCFPGCDFVTAGDACGEPVNRSAPQKCWDKCAAQKSTFCEPNYQWEVLELDKELRYSSVNDSESVFIRFIWDRPCEAFKFEVIASSNRVVVSGSPRVIVPNFALSNCLETNPTSTTAFVCPSNECYVYGTWTLKLECAAVTCDGSIIVRTRPMQSGSPATEPPSDSPASSALPAPFPHTFLPFGVPTEHYFAPNELYALYGFMTDYCGPVSISVEIVKFAPDEWAGVAMGISFDASNYAPLTRADLIFIDSSSRPIWVCPDAATGTPALVFLGVSRYSLSTNSFPNGLTVLLLVDTPRPSAIPWPRYKIGQPPGQPEQSASADGTMVTATYSEYYSFPSTSTFWTTFFAANTFSLTCGDQSFNCLVGASNFASCTELTYSFPQIPDPRALLPMPPALAALDTSAFGTLDYTSVANATLASSTLGIAFQLSVSVNGVVQSQPLGANWEELLPSCTLVTGNGSPFHDSNGMWFHGALTFNVSQPVCNGTRFAETSDSIDDLANLMISEPAESTTWRYFADLLTFDAPWQGCQAFVTQTLMQSVSEDVNIVLSTACINADDTDPCCSADVAWTQCCLARNFTFNMSNLPSEPASITTDEVCADSSCIDPLLSEYGRFSFYDFIGECDTPNILSQNTATVSSLYRECFELYFGDELNGRMCFYDEHCVDPQTGQDIGATCDHYSHRCVETLSTSTPLFFECLVNILPAPDRIALLAAVGWTSDNNFSAPYFLQQHYTVSDVCTNINYGGPFGITHANIKPYSSVAYCPVTWMVDILESADRAKQTPFWADIHPASTCSFVYDYTAQETKAECQASGATCNWNFTADAEDCSLGVGATSGTVESFCGICESDIHCFPIDGVDSSQVCALLPDICLLANGSTIAGLSEEECSSVLSCSITCPGCNQAECESLAGVCTDSESIYYGMYLTPYTLYYTASGFCSFPMYPFNSPSCDSVQLMSLPTSFGCVTYMDCQFGSGATTPTCTPDYQAEDTCTNAGGTWYPYALTKDVCEAEMRCEESLPTVLSASRSGTSLLSNKNEAECTACDGTYRSINTWIAGQWIGGNLRKPSWRDRGMTLQQDFGTTIDFSTLASDLQTAALVAIAPQLLNNLQCSFQATKQLINIAVCDCSGLVDDPRNNCFPQSDQLELGLIRVCPETEQTFFAQPAKIEVSLSSLSDQVTDRCIDVRLYRLPAVQFDPLPSPRLSPGFLKRPPFPGTGSYASVIYQNAIVGQVLGDGIQFSFNSSTDLNSLQSLYLCTALSNNIEHQKDKYPIIALGIVDGDGVVHPWTPGLDAVLNPGSGEQVICGTITFETHAKKRATFLPIALQSDWDTQSYESISSGQLGLAYFVAVLYAIVSFCILAHILRLLVLGGFSVTQATNTVWIAFFFTCIIRSIYLFLMASHVLGQEKAHQLVDFWMTDLPLILYMIGNLSIGLSFLFIFLRRIESKPRDSKQFWLLFTIVTAILVFLFVGVLIAFNYRVIVIPEIEGSLLCPTLNDTASTARTIRIIYVSILVFIGVCIAITEFGMSVGVFRQIRSSNQAWKPFLFAIISSAGVLADDIAFLVYYIVDTPTTYFLIVMIFTEIIPIAVVLAILGSSQEATRTATQSGTRSK